jgi:RHS repeat-associated protein
MNKFLQKFIHKLIIISLCISLQPFSPTSAKEQIHSQIDTQPIQEASQLIESKQEQGTSLSPLTNTITTILDTFNRSNGPIGSQWVGSTSSYSVDTNTLRGNGDPIYWNASFSENQEISITLATIDTNASEINILLKAQDNTACNFIMLFYDAGSEAAQVWTCHDGGVWLQHGSDIPVSLQNGDRFGAQIATDGSLAIYHNDALIGTVVISSSWPFLAHRGKLGLWLIDPGTTAIDDFAGGSLLSTSTPTLQITGSPTTGSIEITSLERFRLVFDAAHAWQPGIWNDLTSDPAINLSRNDLSTLNYTVIQSPLELYDGSWNTLSTVLTPTIEVITQTTSLIELHTQWFWQTANNNLFSVRTEHVIHANGLWDVATAVTNVGSSPVTFGNGTHGLRYAFTNPCPIYSWTEALAANNNSFSHTRDDGAEPYPRILVTRDEPLGSFGTDGDLNRYWELSNALTLAPNASWSTSWTNQIWFGPSTPPVDPPVSHASLALTPPSAGPNVQGTQQRMQATLLTQHSEPITNTEVLFTITGANPSILSAITDIDGTATITYTGTYTGTDSIVATAEVQSATVTSNIASIGWVVPLQPITTSTVWGQFFPTQRWDYIIVTPEDTPSLSMAFPTVNFNPPNASSVIPGNTSGINEYAKPFTTVSTDVYGNYNGIVVAQDENYRPGVLDPPSMTFFNAVFTGKFTVAEAGTYTLRFWSDDAFILGIGDDGFGNQPSRISGEYNNLPNPGTTPIMGYRIMGGRNRDQPPQAFAITVNFPAAGSYPYELDFAQVNFDRMTLTMVLQDPITGLNQSIAPSGSLSLNPMVPSSQVVGQNQAFSLYALDAAGEAIANTPVTLLIDGTNKQEVSATTSITGFVSIDYSGFNPGRDTLQAVIWSHGSPIYSNQVDMTWTASTTPNSPSVNEPLAVPGQIASPTNLSTVTGQIPITLATGLPAQTCTVDYWPADDNTATNTLASNITAGSGTTLATLDTTLLANGSYVIRTACTNSTGTLVQSGVMVTVSGDYKPGRVRFEVTDLTIPLSGLPITVGRVYDSLERQRSGDFGYGWSLSLGSPRLEVDLANNVTLTQPNGQRVTFYFTPASYGGVFGFLQKPTYTPEAGVYGTLTANGCAIVVPSGGRHLCFLDTASYQPTTYTYTDPYGRVFVMSADGSLQSITDLHQNTLTFSDDGITSSAGGRSVAFNRDSQNRITEVVDPAGNSYSYSYDSQGDLIAVGYPGLTTPTNYEYDTDHLITEIIDARGNSAAVASYDTDGRLISETDAVGNTTTYSYTLSTRTTTITHPDGGVQTIVANSQGRTLSDTDPLNRTTTYTYDAKQNLSSYTDALGRTTTYTYDSNGHQSSITGPLGATSSTTYNKYGGPTSITDMVGNQQNVSYDASYVPLSISDALGTRASFTFDDRGSLLTMTDGNGNPTHYTYDQFGNQLTFSDPLSRTVSFTYDQLGRQINQTDPLGQTTHYGYDALGHTIAITDALGFVTTSSYDANGNQTSQTDARGNSTIYTFDAANRVINTRFADTSAITSTYDFRGNPLTETDSLGRVTRYVYDLAGQLTSVTEADGTPQASTVSYTYNAIGERISTTDARGNTNTTAYTDQPVPHTRRITQTSPAPFSYQTVTTLNAIGQVITSRDASLRDISYSYDVRGRQTHTLFPDSTTHLQSYDDANNLISRTDQAGLTTYYSYDQANQILSVTDPLSHTTSYNYDLVGNLISVTDARSNTTHFAYDAVSRPISETLPLGQTALSSYDAVGNLLSQTDFNGNTTTSSYDVLNRLILITPDISLSEPTIGFSYTPTGQRASMTDGTGTTTYAYDAHDQLISKATPQGTLSYGYDLAGNLISTQSNHTNGITVTYTYDSLNRLSSVNDHRLSPGTSTYVYSPTSTLASLTLPNGVVTRYGYDTLDRLTSLVTKKDSITLASYGYTLLANGQRSQVVELGGRSVAYAYDDAQRLISEIITGGSPNGTIGYSYDAVGNRLSRSSTVAGISASSATYDANDRLIGTSYDDNGNTLSAGGISYSYDFANRLLSATGGISIAYDGDGNRVAETAGGTTTTFLVDELNPTGFPQVVEELVGGVVQRTYTYGRDLISQNHWNGSSWTPSYHLADGLGSVRTLTDASGSATDSYTYDAFGSQIATSGSTPNRYGFTGEQFDDDLGLYYLRARYYNQRNGRFLNRDIYPLNQSNPREWNRYSYVAGDPVNAVDPSGYILAETSKQNQQSGKAAAGAEPVGAEIGTTVARSAATFERGIAQHNFNRFFGYSLRPPSKNPVTVGQGDFVDIHGIQRQFVGTNNFYGNLGRRLEAMAQQMKAANPQARFLGGQYGSNKHFEELVIEHIKRNISQIPDQGRVAVGVANIICKSKCQPLLINRLGGQVIGNNTIIVTLERGIKIVFVATGL